MSRNKIMVILLVMLSIGVISLYTTYAYDEDNSFVNSGISDSDYNLIYSIKDNSSKEINVSPGVEKYVDINLTNTYSSTIRYGMYYYMVEPSKLPDNVIVSLAEYSDDKLEDVIKAGDTRNISLKITNNSEYSIKLMVGALIGFENGKIEDLVTNGEILIK